MRRLLLALSFAAIPFVASAAGWDSGMQDDEGGPTMMAWVYGAEGGDTPPELRMFCGDQVSLRYGQRTLPGGEPEPIMEPVEFTFDFGDDIIPLDMQYEDMDGMYAAYIPTDALILGYLRSKDSVAVEAPLGPWPAQEFTLDGSSKAIAALLKTCD